MLPGIDHGAVHVAEHLGKLPHRVGQRVPLGHPRAHLQQQRLGTRPPALFGRGLQALVEGQAGLDQCRQLAGQQGQFGGTDARPKQVQAQTAARQGFAVGLGHLHRAQFLLAQLLAYLALGVPLEDPLDQLAAGIECAITEGGHGIS